jgi:hypothetical protein
MNTMNIGPLYNNLDDFSKLWEHIKSFYGGYYPIGANNYWHTGLHVKGIEPVKAIAPGEIIAYRTTCAELDYVKIFKMFNDDKYPTISRFHYDMAKDYIDSENNLNLKEILDKYYDTDGTNDPIPRRKNSNPDGNDGKLIKRFLYCTSNNFVLVEHTIPFVKENEDAIKYYSLYMHLKAISTLTQSDQNRIYKSFEYEKMPNELNKQFVKNVKNQLPVDRDSELGFPGYIPYQSNICHIEIFSSDKRILELWKHIDPTKANVYGIGEYQVNELVECELTLNYSEKLTLNKDDKIQYYDVSPDHKGVIDRVWFKKESKNDEKIYGVKTNNIKREGYKIEGERIFTDNPNGKIVYRDPLFWHNFSSFEEPDGLFGLNKRNNKCDIPAIIKKLQSGPTTDNNVDRSEITNAIGIKALYTELSRMIVYSNSEWDGKRLEGIVNSLYRLFSDDERMKRKECHVPLQITNKVTPLEKIDFFYFFHPGMFIENISKLFTSDGWKLTKSGALLQGKTGWLIDENGYYILQDGRRLPENVMSDNDKGLRIGHEQPKAGLDEIMKCAPEIEIKINAEYNVYNDLLNPYGSKMQNDVVYQAFQINTGYILKDNEWKNFGIGSWNNAKFKSIGKDETDIPIIVTRIGLENAEKKLVIAGPHADERNAQRVAMITQRYFTNNGLTVSNLALYFIPSISPTMTFADARGIPNSFFVNNNEAPIDDNETIFKIKKRFKLGSYLTIPDLHNKMNAAMRENIQNQQDPGKPIYGIDANRDVFFSLPSNRAFLKFICSLTGTDITTGSKSKRNGEENLNVFMMHGYTYPGDVYGPYTVTPMQSTSIVDMNITIQQYVNYIALSLFNTRYKPNTRVTGTGILKQFFFGDTQSNPQKYAGEWCRCLYGEMGERGILSFDIELPGFIEINGGEKNVNYYLLYDEGRREDPNRPYTPSRIGSASCDENIPNGKTSSSKRPFFDPANEMKLIVSTKDETLRFYDFLKQYFFKREANL